MKYRISPYIFNFSPIEVTILVGRPMREICLDVMFLHFFLDKKRRTITTSQAVSSTTLIQALKFTETLEK